MNENEKEVEKKLDNASGEQDKGVKTDEKDNSGQKAPADQKTDEIDYAAELRKERDRREKAEAKIVDLKKNPSKAKAEDDEDDDEDDEDVEDIIDRKVDERLSALTADLVDDHLQAELESLSSDKAERELILFHYENTLKKSGLSRAKIREDLAKARLLANSSRYVRENTELKEALKSKNSISNSGAGNNQDKQVPAESEIELSEADKALLQRHGLTAKDVKITQ